jgi:hypothetical protein
MSGGFPMTLPKIYTGLIADEFYSVTLSAELGSIKTTMMGVFTAFFAQSVHFTAHYHHRSAWRLLYLPLQQVCVVKNTISIY